MTVSPGAREVDPQAEADRLAAERIAIDLGRAPSFSDEEFVEAQKNWRASHSASPPPSVLSHDEIRALLAHTALVLKPGETLILRVKDLTPRQMREYQDALNEVTEHAGWPKVIVVTGDEMGVVRADDDAAFAERVMDAINSLDVRASVYNGAGGDVTARRRFLHDHWWPPQDEVPPAEHPEARIARQGGGDG